MSAHPPRPPDLATDRPAGAVAWLAVPHQIGGLQQVTRGLAAMYDDKDLRLVPADGGYWVITEKEHWR